MSIQSIILIHRSRFSICSRKAREYLKPGRQLIIAIENKYGLKYWAGAKEDHTGVEFDGIQNYSGVNRVRTFSRALLTRLLCEAGFKDNDFYYPFLIISSRWRFTHLSIFRVPVSSYRILRHMTETEWFCLMKPRRRKRWCRTVCSRNSPTHSWLSAGGRLIMDKMIYIKYNSLRKPEYRVSTEIRENDDGMRSVVKRPMNRASAAQINTIKSNFTKLSGLYRNVGIIPFTENGDVLVFPFIFSRPLAADIDLQHMSTDEIYGRIDETLKIIYDFREDAGNFVITDRFKSAFPGLVPGENEPAYSVTNIDSNIDNFLVSEGKVWCIDYEWVFDFPVPVRYVRFRTLLYYYAKQNAFIADRISADEFYSHFGYTNEDVRLFTEMEDCFQQYVHGTDRRYIVTSHYEDTQKLC